MAIDWKLGPLLVPEFCSLATPFRNAVPRCAGRPRPGYGLVPIEDQNAPWPGHGMDW